MVQSDYISLHNRRIWTPLEERASADILYHPSFRNFSERRILAQTTHLAIGTHPDDVEIMAHHGIGLTYLPKELRQKINEFGFRLTRPKMNQHLRQDYQ